MSSLLSTFMIAFALLLLAAAGLGIGMILTGKNKLRRMCGRTPQQQKTKKCGKDVTCPLCNSEVKKNEDDQ